MPAIPPPIINTSVFMLPFKLSKPEISAVCSQNEVMGIPPRITFKNRMSKKAKSILKYV